MRETDSIGWYLNQIGRYPLLTAEEEVLLSRQVQQGLALREVESPTAAQARLIRLGERARLKMFNCNLRLVVSIAKRYMPVVRSLDLSDLVQEGSIGLNRAIEKFDYSRGYKFSTYGYWWIRQGIVRAISQQDRTVRLPVNAIECLSKVRNWAPSFIREHHRAPTPKECAEFCEVSIHVMRGYLEHAAGCISLDATANSLRGDKHTSTLVELVESRDASPMEALEADSLLAKLDGWLDALSDKERALVTLRHGIDRKSDGMSQVAVAKRMGCTRQNVQQLEQRVMTKLRLQAMRGVAA